MAFCLYLPFIAQPPAPAPARGTAGCGPTPTTAAAESWCYNYYPPDSGVVPLISSRLMAMAGNPPLKPTQNYVMLFNEPDNSDPNAGDGITPQQAAIKFNQWAAQLPNARMVCCGNLGPTTGWIDEFIALCNCLSKLAGISFHDYAELWIDQNATDAQKLANWTQHAQVWANWTRAHNGAYPTRKLELWITEMGWSPCCEPDETTALRHMTMLCGALKQIQPDRYAWFGGLSDAVLGTAHLGLLNSDGTVNALGQQWRMC